MAVAAMVKVSRATANLAVGGGGCATSDAGSWRATGRLAAREC